MYAPLSDYQNYFYPCNENKNSDDDILVCFVNIMFIFTEEKRFLKTIIVCYVNKHTTFVIGI